MRWTSLRARAGRIADVAARVEAFANFGGIDPARDALVVGKQRRERVRITGCERIVRPHRTLTDHFVQLLAVAAALGGLHEDRFRTGKGPVRAQVLDDAALVDAQPVDDFAREREDLVGAQQRFRENRAAVRAVVERALEEVRRRVLPRDVGVRREQPRERVDALGHHGIALERHRARADLLGAEGLGDLAETRAREDAHVERELRKRRAQTRERREQQIIQLARIGLRRDVARAEFERAQTSSSCCCDERACRRAAGCTTPRCPPRRELPSR